MAESFKSRELAVISWQLAVISNQLAVGSWQWAVGGVTLGTSDLPCRSLPGARSMKRVCPGGLTLGILLSLGYRLPIPGPLTQPAMRDRFWSRWLS